MGYETTLFGEITVKGNGVTVAKVEGIMQALPCCGDLLQFFSVFEDGSGIRLYTDDYIKWYDHENVMRCLMVSFVENGYEAFGTISYFGEDRDDFGEYHFEGTLFKVEEGMLVTAPALTTDCKGQKLYWSVCECRKSNGELHPYINGQIDVAASELLPETTQEEVPSLFVKPRRLNEYPFLKTYHWFEDLQEAAITAERLKAAADGQLNAYRKALERKEGRKQAVKRTFADAGVWAAR